MKNSDKLLVVVLLSFALFGAVEGIQQENRDNAQALSVIHSLVLTILTFAWCKAHSLEHGINSVGGYRLWAAILPPLGVPTYFYKYYGLKSGSKKVAKFIGFMLLSIAAYGIPYNI